MIDAILFLNLNIIDIIVFAIHVCFESTMKCFFVCFLRIVCISDTLLYTFNIFINRLFWFFLFQSY